MRNCIKCNKKLKNMTKSGRCLDCYQQDRKTGGTKISCIYCNKVIKSYPKAIEKGHNKCSDCYKKIRIKNRYKDGVSYNKEISSTKNIWRGMIYRCNEKSGIHYECYGKRGIKVCDRRYDFDNFLKDMGVRPEKTTIDRIDNDGDYCKENCRRATMQEQASNKRNNVSYNGKCSAEWAREFGITPSALCYKLKKFNGDFENVIIYYSNKKKG